MSRGLDREAMARRLLSQVRKRPGQGESTLAKRVKISPTAASWLLWHLEQTGHVERTLLLRRHAFIPAGADVAATRKAIRLEDPGLRMLHAYVTRRPKVSRQEIIRTAVQEWGWLRNTAIYRLKVLARDGIMPSTLS